MNIRKAALILFLCCLTSITTLAKPQGWKSEGEVSGLIGDDWHVKKTLHTVSYARESDLDYIDQVVSKLDSYYNINSGQLGFRAQGPFEFYFCPMETPGPMQPKFSLVRNNPNALGFAVNGTKMCVINLGLSTHSTVSTVYDMQVTSCHEMNHLFMFQVPYRETAYNMTWFLEALAHEAEEGAKPARARMDDKSLKKFFKGFRLPYTSFYQLADERNAPDNYNQIPYAQYLRSIIHFIRGKYGTRKVQAVVQALSGQSLDSALQQALGVQNSDALFEEWKKYYSMK